MSNETAGRIAAIRERMTVLEPTLRATLSPMVETDKHHNGGPLADLVGTIKDVLVTKGTVTTAGSTMLKDWVGAYDATAVLRLRAAGAALIAKNNCDAWAHGSSTENSDFGPTKNPWDVTRVPGGSSGGSAAAVAAGYGDFSLGTDTGGSIRQPAAFCGVTGLKPTYGRVSRYGLIAMASSLDTVGPLARDAATAARVLEAIAGPDRYDATSRATTAAEFRADDVVRAVDTKPLTGKKIGIPKEYFAEGLDGDVERTVRTAIEELEKLGATLVDVSLPSMHYAIACYYVLMPAEVSSNLGRFDGIRYGLSIDPTRSNFERLSPAELTKRNRAAGFGDEAKRRIILGTFVLSAGYVDAYYRKALRLRSQLAREFADVFEKVDMLATPTTPTVAFPLGANVSDPLEMYLQDIYTVSANLVGIPGVSIPAGFVKPAGGGYDLPVGLQLLGKMYAEGEILRAAHVYQQATDWHTREPVQIQQLLTGVDRG